MSPPRCEPLGSEEGMVGGALCEVVEALGCQEVQAVADLQAVQAVVGRATRRTARPVRPLAVGSCVLRAGEKSPVTGDCHAGIRGSPGVRFPRATRQSEVSENGHGWFRTTDLSRVKRYCTLTSNGQNAC